MGLVVIVPAGLPSFLDMKQVTKMSLYQLHIMKLMLKLNAQTESSALDMESFWSLENPFPSLQSPDFSSLASLWTR